MPGIYFERKSIIRQRIRTGIIFITFLLLPAVYYYFSPYLIIMGASEGIISGSFIVFAFLFLSSLFFGKKFLWLVLSPGRYTGSQF
ncbi:MAG: hypothetical protein L0956_04760 [Candidatus Mariimomonas ferrooxydans]